LVGFQVGTVGSQSKRALIQSRHPRMMDERILTRPSTAKEFDEQLVGALAALGKPEGFDIVLDAVLGPMFDPGWARLARGGRYIVYGAASMTPTGSLGGFDLWNWLTLAWRYVAPLIVSPLIHMLVHTT